MIPGYIMFVIYIYITADYVLIMSETSSDGDDNNDLWSDLIPEELLLIIFSIGAQQYGPVPYLCRLVNKPFYLCIYMI